jgi:hypothetical protein
MIIDDINDESQPSRHAERLARELDWNLLRTFVVLAESRSVTEARRAPRLKQPTVSSALKRLETGSASG